MSTLEIVALVLGIAALVSGAWLVVARVRSGARYLRLLDGLPETAVAVFDRELTFVRAAGAGLPGGAGRPADLRGRTIWDVFPPTEAEALAVHYRAALRGERRSFEYRSVGDGRDYWVRVVPLEETVGEVTEAVAMSIDVTEHERASREAGYRAADVDAVATATRALARSTDVSAARIAVCEGARRVAEAPIAALFEPVAGRSGLRAAAAVGTNLRDFSLSFANEDSGATRAFVGGEAVFATAGDAGSPSDQRFLERSGAVAVLWHPVLRDRQAIGVLAIAWEQPVAGISLRLSGLIDLLGAEAAVAIDRAELLARLEQLTVTDELTGLPNRRAWDQELPRELSRAQRDARPLSVAILDLDHFKAYNDRHGHLAGDELLKSAADAWRAVLRRYDTLARYGGEEFTVILPGCPLEEATPLVERLRAVTPHRETCSAGIAEWDPGEDPSALLGRADAALYRAKRSGRDQAIAVPRPGPPGSQRP